MMKRLTKRRDNGNAYVTDDHCFDTWARSFEGEAIDRLAYYEDMEEQGRLVVLPCKVGDALFDISEFVYGEDCPMMYEDRVRYIELQKDQKTGELVFCIEGTDFKYEDFGKTVFLTREDAERALKEGADHE